MAEIEKKIDDLLKLVHGLGDDMIRSQEDRKAIHQRLSEIKAGVDKTNGTTGDHAKAIAVILEKCGVYTDEISTVKKNFTRLVWTAVGAFITLATTFGGLYIAHMIMTQ